VILWIVDPWVPVICERGIRANKDAMAYARPIRDECPVLYPHVITEHHTSPYVDMTAYDTAMAHAHPSTNNGEAPDFAVLATLHVGGNIDEPAAKMIHCYASSTVTPGTAHRISIPAVHRPFSRRGHTAAGVI